jgi:predicted phosphohydrolase
MSESDNTLNIGSPDAGDEQVMIQYMSDLHLEFYDEKTVIEILNRIEPMCNICVLAGDIGYPFLETYELFLRGISSKFTHVFLIHGNHEYYQCGKNAGKSKEEIIFRTLYILRVNNLSNVHFLDNSYYDLGNLRFVGSTLWSNISDPRYLSNRYDVVYDFSLEQMNQMHYDNREYIKSIIDDSRAENKKIIMITHYLPSHKLNHPKYADRSKYFQCFASHSDDLIKKPIVCWIFGHTHMGMEKYINGVFCAANPIGYPGENMRLSFDKCVLIK